MALLVLQALVRQMHRVIFCWWSVLDTGSAQVKVFVKVNLYVVSDQYPLTNIEFTSTVQKRPFDVLLDNPDVDAIIFLEDLLHNIAHVPENLNASTLIQTCWLRKPHVLRTVFCRNSFVFPTSSRKFFEPLNKCMSFAFIRLVQDQESCRSRIEHSIVSRFRSLITLVIRSQRAD
jgi:hypothetical protein